MVDPRQCMGLAEHTTCYPENAAVCTLGGGAFAVCRNDPDNERRLPYKAGSAASPAEKKPPRAGYTDPGFDELKRLALQGVLDDPAWRRAGFSVERPRLVPAPSSRLPSAVQGRGGPWLAAVVGSSVVAALAIILLIVPARRGRCRPVASLVPIAFLPFVIGLIAACGGVALTLNAIHWPIWLLPRAEMLSSGVRDALWSLQAGSVASAILLVLSGLPSAVLSRAAQRPKSVSSPVPGIVLCSLVGMAVSAGTRFMVPRRLAVDIATWIVMLVTVPVFAYGVSSPPPKADSPSVNANPGRPLAALWTPVAISCALVLLHIGWAFPWTLGGLISPQPGASYGFRWIAVVADSLFPWLLALAAYASGHLQSDAVRVVVVPAGIIFALGVPCGATLGALHSRIASASESVSARLPVDPSGQAVELPSLRNPGHGLREDVPMVIMPKTGGTLYDDSRGKAAPRLLAADYLPAPNSPRPFDEQARPPFFQLLADGDVQYSRLTASLTPLTRAGYTGYRVLARDQSGKAGSVDLALGGEGTAASTAPLTAMLRSDPLGFAVVVDGKSITVRIRSGAVAPGCSELGTGPTFLDHETLEDQQALTRCAKKVKQASPDFSDVTQALIVPAADTPLRTIVSIAEALMRDFSCVRSGSSSYDCSTSAARSGAEWIFTSIRVVGALPREVTEASKTSGLGALSLPDFTTRDVPVKGPSGHATMPGPIVKGGTIPNAARIVAGMRAGFRACYNRALAKEPEQQGDVSVTAKVGPEGAVSNVATKRSARVSKELEQCVAGRARAAQFDPPDEQRAVTVEFTVTFSLVPPASPAPAPSGPK